LQRKGAAKYLQSKLIRLGLPLILNSTILDPALFWFVQVVILKGQGLQPQGYQYKLELGVAWFILWLLVLDVAHIALKDLKVPIVSLPTRPWLLVWGAFLGLVQGSIGFLQGGALPFDYGFLRLQWALAPSFAVFYVCGSTAYRNQWLQELQVWTRGAWTSVFVLTLLAIAGVAPLLLFMQSLSRAGLMMLWGVTSGMLALLVSLSMIFIFKAVADFKNPFTGFLGAGAYGAYLLHPWVLTLVAWSYGLLLAAAGVDARLAARGNIWVILGGCGYTILTAIPATWAVSWSLGRLPGLRHIM
jgi:hypothetical protein